MKDIRSNSDMLKPLNCCNSVWLISRGAMYGQHCMDDYHTLLVILQK